MCGIVGILYPELHSTKVEDNFQLMIDQLEHRGPDDSGDWHDHNKGILLGHRRLAIHDLSLLGKQPMTSSSGRYVIVYNGEVYNFIALREMLADAGHFFRGRSDTEVMLAAFEEWGICQAVEKFIGMFAFGVWDRKEEVLTLARDRLGEKPLYYGWQGQAFLFGSELKALRAYENWQGEINHDSLAEFLQYSHVPEPFSIYKSIFKLPPGSLLTVSSNIKPDTFSPFPSSTGRRHGSPDTYWSTKKVVEHGLADQFMGSDKEAVDALEELLSAAVHEQMVADVPLGAFLSGGIDSSTVVALMQAQSERPVKTFTIGFHEKGYNEAEFAQQVANHLGTDHTELYVTPEEAREVIPRLPLLYDEPFADSSQIPTFLISELARRKVKVSLSGDGGDELFGGYNRYFWGKSIWKKIGWAPCFARRGLASLIKVIPPSAWDNIYHTSSFLIQKNKKIAHPGDRIHKLSGIVDAATPEEMYTRLVSFWRDPHRIVLRSSGNIRENILNTPGRWAKVDNFIDRMMFLDMSSYLPNDILVKVDRAAMGVSLETRLPMLNQKVVEFAWRLPLSMKVRSGQGKWVLRQVLYRHVPKEFIERPKMGFGIPIDNWLRGPLRDWAEDLLNRDTLLKQGLLNPDPIQEKWQEHLSGKRNWQYLLWNVIMFQAWFENWE